MSERIEFVRRAQVEEQLQGIVVMRRWRSTCGRYRVSESHWTCGDVPVVYIAEHSAGSCWCVISRHRVRARAEAACRDHFKANQTPARKTRAGSPARTRRTAAPTGLAAPAAITPGAGGCSQ